MFSMKIRWVKVFDSIEQMKQLTQNNRNHPLRIHGKAVLLVHHENNFYLVKNKCPHQGITLEQSKCEDGFLVCPWHRYGFDLKTGRGAGLYLENYPIEIRGDGVFAGFEYFSLF
jgi:3-phenylpropionate/trans-cinnamate dioxygenase ferredoxin subunit